MRSKFKFAVFAVAVLSAFSLTAAPVIAGGKPGGHHGPKIHQIAPRMHNPPLERRQQTLRPRIEVPSGERNGLPGVTEVADDCYSEGQKAAAQLGGTLAAAKSVIKGSQPVCVLVILIPGRNGQRPRRHEIVVPQ